jgi:hypothetical protein
MGIENRQNGRRGPRAYRSHAIRFGVVVLLGLVLTIAIAWLSPWMPRPQSQTSQLYDAPSGVPGATRLVRFTTFFETSYSVDGNGELPSDVRFGEVNRFFWLDARRVPPAAPLSPAATSPGYRWAVLVNGYGWPLRAFWGRGTNEYSGWTRVGGNGEGWIDLFAGAGGAGVPVWVLWYGFMFDWCFFSLAVTACLFGPGRLRRRRRRRRGACPMCAYDLRNDFAGGCSECGWNRPI